MLIDMLEGSQGILPRIGEVVQGTLISKEPRRVFIDLGSLGTGVVYGVEYIRSRDEIKDLKPGAPITVKIISLENEEGFIEVSLKEAGKDETWNRLKTLKQDRVILRLPVIEANRGGLIMELNGIRGFLPVSQLTLEHYPRVEGGEREKIFEKLSEFVGKELNVRILDVQPKEEKLIFSEKEAEENELRQRIEKYRVGDVVEGVVTAVVNFGAFVKFGAPPLEGLIHISEFDYKLIDDPRKYLNIGDAINAKIIAIENNRISLSLKALKENPWEKVLERYEREAVYPGRVIKITPFGALVELDPEIHGIVHVSQFSNDIDALKKALEPGNNYKFKVLSIEPKEKRIGLDIYRETNEPLTS